MKNTLDLRIPNSSKPIPSWVFGGLVAGIFIAITGLAMLSGSWQNNISRQEYQMRFQQLESPAYSHPFSGSSDYGPN